MNTNSENQTFVPMEIESKQQNDTFEETIFPKETQQSNQTLIDLSQSINEIQETNDIEEQKVQQQDESNIQQQSEETMKFNENEYRNDLKERLK